MRRFWITVGIVLTASCADRAPLEPGASASRLPSAAREGGFPLVHVRSHGAPRDHAGPVVDNLADALAAVSPGGTIRVFDGTYAVEGVRVDKPVTIEAGPGARPVLRTEELDGNPATISGLVIEEVPEGPVVLRNLGFENVRHFASISAAGVYDQVLVEGGEFRITSSWTDPSGGPKPTHTGVFAGSSTLPTARVIVRNSHFVGGASGVYAARGRMDVLNSAFSDHVFSGIQYQQGSSGRIEGNTVTRCGPFGCIRVHDPAGVEVIGNRVENEWPRAVDFGIRVFAFSDGRQATLRNNEVVGTGGSGEDHGFRFGIEINRANAILTGNRIGGARHGIQTWFVSEATIEGNVVDPCGSWTCVGVGGGGQRVTIRNNQLVSHLARQTFFGILAGWPAGSGVLAITDNRIVGANAPADPGNSATYELEIGIQVGAWNPGQTGLPRGEPVEISRNLIQYSAVGVRAFHGGVVEGTDNRFDTVQGEVLGAHDLAINRIQRSDITGYTYSLSLSAGGELNVICNWWGSADGPRNTGDASPSSYTPWATAPIAGTGAACGDSP